MIDSAVAMRTCSPITDTEDPSRRKLRIDKLEPRRTYERTEQRWEAVHPARRDMEDPKFVKSSTERSDPNLANERIDIADPATRVFTTDNA
jgi:hypothetical protein